MLRASLKISVLSVLTVSLLAAGSPSASAAPPESPFDTVTGVVTQMAGPGVCC